DAVPHHGDPRARLTTHRYGEKNMSEALVHDVSWHINYKFQLGSTWSRFLVSLRDDKVILGTTCERCQRTYVPPQRYCEICFEPIDTWVEVAPTGTVHAGSVTMKS